MALQPYHGRKLFLTRWIIKFIPSEEDPLDFNVKLSGLMTPTPVGPIEDTDEYPRRRKRKYYTFTPYTTDYLEIVHGAKLLEFENKEVIALVDGMSYEEGLKIGYPSSFIDYFRLGFPPTWEFIISKFYLSKHRCITNGEVPRAIKSILKGPSQNLDQVITRAEEKTNIKKKGEPVLKEQNKKNEDDDETTSKSRKKFCYNKKKSLSQVNSSQSQKKSENLNISFSTDTKKGKRTRLRSQSNKTSQKVELAINSKTKKPRQSLGNDYNFTFLPRRSVESTRNEFFLPKCI